MDEPSAECYIAAGDRQQSWDYIFDVACGMVRADNQLNKNLKVFKNSIIHEKSNSAFKAISSEASLVSLDTTLVSFVWTSFLFRKTLVCGML